MRHLLTISILVVGLLAPGGAMGQEDPMAALVSLLKESDDTQLQLDILKGMSEGLKGQRNVKAPQGWDEVESKLLSASHPEIQSLATSLSLVFGSKGAMAVLRQRLADTSLPTASRRDAMDALVGARDAQLVPILKTLLANNGLRGAALRALAAYDDSGTPAAILEVYPDLTPVEKRDALATLSSRVSFAQALMKAIADGTVPSKDLSADIVRQLRALKNEALNLEIETLWGVVRASPAEKQSELAHYKKLIQDSSKGTPDASRGRAVFARVCQQCHTLFGEGGKVGPDITGSNRADLDYILHNILDPNAEIPNDYRSTTIDTRDDRVITGIVTRQDTASVTIVTANETLVLPKSDILSMRQGELSMMPEGLLASLSEKEIRDLIAYLASPTQVSN